MTLGFISSWFLANVLARSAFRIKYINLFLHVRIEIKKVRIKEFRDHL